MLTVHGRSLLWRLDARQPLLLLTCFHPPLYISLPYNILFQSSFLTTYLYVIYDVLFIKVIHRLHHLFFHLDFLQRTNYCRYRNTNHHRTRNNYTRFLHIRQSDNQPDRQTDRQTNRQTDRQTNKQIKRVTCSKRFSGARVSPVSLYNHLPPKSIDSYFVDSSYILDFYFSLLSHEDDSEAT